MESNVQEVKNGTVDNRPEWASITSFVCSLVGIFLFGILLGIIAIVFGAISLKQQ